MTAWTRLSARLSASGLLIGLLSVILANKAFALGVWQQSEPVIIAAHCGAALCWAGLSMAWGRGHAPSMLRSALVWPALGLAGWSLIAAVLAEFPGLGVLGPPQSGEGPLWYLDLAAYTMAAWRLRDDDERVFDGLILIGGVLVLVVGICNLSRAASWFPFHAPSGFFSFTPFLGYSALALLPAAWSMRDRGNGLWRMVAAVGFAGVLMSRNRTAMVGGVLIVACLLMPLRFAVPAWLVRQRTAVIIAVIAATSLAPYALLHHVDWFHGVFSLWSRSILLSTIAPHVLENVKTALFGHGWGHFTEYLARHVADTGVPLVVGRWKDLYRDEFHSHNAALEAAFSAGLPGLALAILLRAGIAQGAAAPARPMAFGFAVALTLTDATWFMLPVSIAPLGMALAALAPRAIECRKGLCAGRSITLTAAGCGVMTMAAAIMLLGNALATTHVRECLPPFPFVEGCAQAAIPRDPRGQEVDLATLINDAVSGAVGNPGTDSLQGVQGEFMAGMIGIAAERMQNNASALLPIAIANSLAASAFASAAAPLLPITPDMEALWRRALSRLNECAPNRLDLVVTYLNWLIREGRDGSEDTLLPELERRHPSHPVALWFRGLRLITEPAPNRQAEGLAMLRRAIDSGVGNFVPITEAMASSLGTGTTR